MIYPNVPVKKWAAKYDLDLTPDPCERCGKILDQWIPFATKDLRGAVTKPHGCPKEYDQSVFIWADEKRRNDWKDLMSY
jgi:hypothetical protein